MTNPLNFHKKNLKVDNFGKLRFLRSPFWNFFLDFFLDFFLLGPHENQSQRAIFQTFWKVHCCTKSLFFDIETSNFGSSYVFLSPLKWRGRILHNLTFWTQKRHISSKMQVCTIIQKSLFLELETSNFGSSHVFLSPLKWQGQILPNLIFRN